jgi:hypothetical protein
MKRLFGLKTLPKNITHMLGGSLNQAQSDLYAAMPVPTQWVVVTAD